MSRHRYVKDYRLNEYIAENGRVTSESEYIGGDYRFAAGAARAKAAANRALALCALCWAGYLALICVDGTAMRTVYVALPFAFTALPLFFLTRAALLARRSAEPLKHDVADKIGHAAPAAALWATLLPGAGFLGCLISSLAGAKGWDALFLSVSAVMTACAAACFAIRRDFYTEKQ